MRVSSSFIRLLRIEKREGKEEGNRERGRRGRRVGLRFDGAGVTTDLTGSKIATSRKGRFAINFFRIPNELPVSE